MYTSSFKYCGYVVVLNAANNDNRRQGRQQNPHIHFYLPLDIYTVYVNY